MIQSNRVAGRASPPGSHTTVHTGPRAAVPDSPCGRSSTLSLPRLSLPGARPVGFNAPGQDHRWSCLPAKFSPSRVVRPSGLFVAGGLGRQASLSKDVNSRWTTGPFISGTEHRTALCGASLCPPSTLLKSRRDAMIIAQGKRETSAALGYGRRINPSPFSWFAAPGRPGAANQEKGEAGYRGVAFYPGRRPRRPCPGLLSRCPSGAPNFDRWLPAHETSRFRSCFGLMFGPSCPSL